MRSHSARQSVFFFSSRTRHTRCLSDWSSDVCSSDLPQQPGSPTARSQLQDTQARYSREVAIIRKKGGTASPQSCHKLKRVGRLHSRYGSQLRSGAQMIARNLCNMNTATPREKSFITLCQQVVSRTIGNDQTCQQR